MTFPAIRRPAPAEYPASYEAYVSKVPEGELHRILEQLQVPERRPDLPGAANLAKLRALMDVARALQNSLSTQDVLVAVVDAAVAITAAERGFMLFQRSGQDLEISAQSALIPKF